MSNPSVYNQINYGLNQPLNSSPFPPVVANRAPLSTDLGFGLGQLWINKVASTAYILVQRSAGAAVWSLLEVGSGAGSFSTLTSTGATTLATTGASVNSFGNNTGATSVTISSGTGGTVLNTAATGTITLGSAAMTGTITIGNSTAGQAINIGSAAGTDTITIGNNHLTSTINLIAGTTGISVTSPNFISSGYFSGTTFYATGDAGGAASTVAITDVSDLTANSSGTFTILSKSANNLNSSGFVKIYIGVTAYYIPVFSATAP